MAMPISIEPHPFTNSWVPPVNFLDTPLYCMDIKTTACSLVQRAGEKKKYRALLVQILFFYSLAYPGGCSGCSSTPLRFQFINYSLPSIVFTSMVSDIAMLPMFAMSTARALFLARARQWVWLEKSGRGWKLSTVEHPPT